MHNEFALCDTAYFVDQAFKFEKRRRLIQQSVVTFLHNNHFYKLHT